MDDWNFPHAVSADAPTKIEKPKCTPVEASRSFVGKWVWDVEDRVLRLCYSHYYRPYENNIIKTRVAMRSEKPGGENIIKDECKVELWRPEHGPPPSGVLVMHGMSLDDGPPSEPLPTANHRRSRKTRLELSLPPAVCDAIKAHCAREGVSCSEFVAMAVAPFLQNR